MSRPRRRAPRDAGVSGGVGEPVIELALALELGELVIAADMAAVDEDLRHGAQPQRPLDHLGALVAIEGHIDLLEVERFSRAAAAWPRGNSRRTAWCRAGCGSCQITGPETAILRMGPHRARQSTRAMTKAEGGRLDGARQRQRRRPARPSPASAPARTASAVAPGSDDVVDHHELLAPDAGGVRFIDLERAG